VYSSRATTFLLLQALDIQVLNAYQVVLRYEFVGDLMELVVLGPLESGVGLGQLLFGPSKLSALRCTAGQAACFIIVTGVLISTFYHYPLRPLDGSLLVLLLL
jgi:hypothetical protein